MHSIVSVIDSINKPETVPRLTQPVCNSKVDSVYSTGVWKVGTRERKNLNTESYWFILSNICSFCLFAAFSQPLYHGFAHYAQHYSYWLLNFWTPCRWIGQNCFILLYKIFM